MRKITKASIAALLLLGTLAYGTQAQAQVSIVKAQGAVKLATPRNLVLVSGATSITATFSPVANASSYTLRVYPAKGQLMVGAARAQFVSGGLVTGLSALTTYRITVQAIGNGTTFSNSEASDGVRTTTLIDCAHGGACALGDVGPGGGTVFYVSSSAFTAPTANCMSSCRYLEAAPSAGISAFVQDAYQWSHTTSGNVNTDTVLGSGYLNTAKMVMFDATAGYAATVAQSYRGPNNLSDWFLPSEEELTSLVLYSGGSLVSNIGCQWSSSQLLSTWAQTVQKDQWASNDSETKNVYCHVIPVRIF
jgi:hypothetical protein